MNFKIVSIKKKNFLYLNNISANIADTLDIFNRRVHIAMELSIKGQKFGVKVELRLHKCVETFFQVLIDGSFNLFIRRLCFGAGANGRRAI